jgi:hypothetical protein
MGIDNPPSYERETGSLVSNVTAKIGNKRDILGRVVVR